MNLDYSIVAMIFGLFGFYFGFLFGRHVGKKEGKELAIHDVAEMIREQMEGQNDTNGNN